MGQQDLNAFWAELSACEHFVEIYDHDHEFLDTLAAFTGHGLNAGNAAVVIATPAHREGLEQRLVAMDIDVAAARRENRYFDLDAERTLERFMVNGWPDEDLFESVIRGILRQARGTEGRSVLAFGEIVALLWALGHAGATVRLEFLWQQICEKKLFKLFCAYPKAGFTEDPMVSIARVCAMHSKVLSA